MNNKKTIIGSAAVIVAAVALIGGGTFAAWSDFDVVEGQAVGAGALVFDIDDEATPWSGEQLAPGQRVERVWSVDTSASTVPGLLSVAIENWDESEDGCTSASSEFAVDPACDPANGGGQFADFAVMDLAILQDTEAAAECDAGDFGTSVRSATARQVGLPASAAWDWYTTSGAPAIANANWDYTDWSWASSVSDLFESGGVVPTLGALEASATNGVLSTNPVTVDSATNTVCIYAAVAMPILDPEASSEISLAQNAAQGDSVSFGLEFVIEQDVDGTPETPAPAGTED